MMAEEKGQGMELPEQLIMVVQLIKVLSYKAKLSARAISPLHELYKPLGIFCDGQEDVH